MTGKMYVMKNGAWREVQKVWVMKNGQWREVDSVHVMKGGHWIPVQEFSPDLRAPEGSIQMEDREASPEDSDEDTPPKAD